MSQELKCPVCSEELHNLTCQNEECSFSESYTILRNDVTIEETIEQLRAVGAYINIGLQTLVIPGKTIDSVFALDGDRAAILASYLRTTFGMTQRSMQANTALALIHRIRNEETGLPHVSRIGDYPLMHRNEGKLRYLGRQIYEGYYYRGPIFEPKEHNGIFEEWIDTFRWATQEDRALLRAWVLSLFAQRLIPPGRFPALLLGTHSGSSVGKTETANMISKIFGRMMSRFWSSQVAKEADRELLGGEHRFFCADNLVADKSGIISGGNLSEFITKEIFETKRLYATGGTVSAQKPTIDILTANYPVLVLDLLQRVVVVGLKNKPISGNGDWIGKWTKRRREILEEGMHIVQTNSDKFKGVDDCSCGYSDFRYPLWYSIAVECNGGEFSPFPSENCVGCSVDNIFKKYERDDDVEFDEMYKKLQNDFTLHGRKFRRQVGEFSEKKIRGIIKRWSKDYKLQEREGKTWIMMK